MPDIRLLYVIGTGREAALSHCMLLLQADRMEVV